MTVSEWIAYVDQRVWGPGMLVLLMGTGVFLTLRTRFLPWRNLGWALKSVLGRDSRAKAGGAGDVSPFSALMTTLAATIGTGNIVGVATALVAGGPGALVWMEISALFGLSSKCAECLLAVKYRQRDAGGEMRGGPMYTMCAALRWKRLGGALAFLFALFTVLASLGMGDMAQAIPSPGRWPTASPFRPGPPGWQWLCWLSWSFWAVSGGLPESAPWWCPSWRSFTCWRAPQCCWGICPLCPEPWQRCSAWPSLPPPLRVARRGL